METSCSSTQRQQQKLGAFYWIDSVFRPDKTTHEFPEHIDDLLESYTKEYGKPVETLYSWDSSVQSFVPLESDGKLQRLLAARRQELTTGELSAVSLCAIVRAIHKVLEWESLGELPYEPLYTFDLQQGGDNSQIPRFTWKAPSHQSLQAQQRASATVASKVSYYLLRLLREAFKITTAFKDRRQPFTILSGCLGQVLADAVRPQVTDHVVELALMLVSLLLADNHVVQTLESSWVIRFVRIIKNVRCTKIWLCTDTEVPEPAEETKTNTKTTSGQEEANQKSNHRAPSNVSQSRFQPPSDPRVAHTDAVASDFATQQAHSLLTTSIEGRVRTRRQQVLQEWVSSLSGVGMKSLDIPNFIGTRSRQPCRRRTPFTSWLKDIFGIWNTESSKNILIEYLQQISDSICIDQHIAIVTRRILSAKSDIDMINACVGLLKDILDDHADASMSMGKMDSPRILAIEGLLLNVPSQSWKTMVENTIVERVLVSKEQSLEQCYSSLKGTIADIQQILHGLPRSIANFRLFERDERLRYQLDIILLIWRSIALSGKDTVELCGQTNKHTHNQKQVSHYNCYCRSQRFTCDPASRLCPVSQTESTWEYISIMNMVQLLLDSKIKVPFKEFNWHDHLRVKNNDLVKGFLQCEFSGKNLHRLLSILSHRELQKAIWNDGGDIKLWDLLMERSGNLQPLVFWHATVGNLCLGLFAVTLNCEKPMNDKQAGNSKGAWQWKTPVDSSKCIRNRMGAAIVEFAAQHIWILMQHLATHRRYNCNLHSHTYSPLNYSRALQLIAASLNMTIQELFPYWGNLREWFLPESTRSNPAAESIKELASASQSLRDRNMANPFHEDVPWIDPFNALTIMQCVGAHVLQNVSPTASDAAVAAVTNALMHPQLSILVHNGDSPLYIIRRMFRQVSLKSTVDDPQRLLNETQNRINELLEAHWHSSQMCHRTSVSAADSGRVCYFRTLMIHQGFVCWWIVTSESERLLKQIPTLITIVADGCLQCMECWKQVQIVDSTKQSKHTIVLQGVISKAFQYAACGLSKLLHLIKLATETTNYSIRDSFRTSALATLQSMNGTIVSLCWSMLQFPDFEVVSHAAFASWCLTSLCKHQIAHNVGPWEKLSKTLLRWIVSCVRLAVYYGGVFKCPEDVAGERESKIHRWREWIERKTTPSQEEFPDPTPFFTLIFHSQPSDGADVRCSSFDIFLSSNSSRATKAKVWTFHEFFRTIIAAFHVLCTVGECNLWLLHGDKLEVYSSKRPHSFKTQTLVSMARYKGLSSLMFALSTCNKLTSAISGNFVEDPASALSQRMLISCVGALLESTCGFVDAAMATALPVLLYVQCAHNRSAWHIVQTQALRVLIAMFDLDSARLVRNLEEIFGRAALETLCISLLETPINCCKGKHTPDSLLDGAPVAVDLLHSHASGALARLSSKLGARERLLEIQMGRRIGNIIFVTDQVDVVANCLLATLNVSTVYPGLPKLVAVARMCLVFAKSPMFYSLQIMSIRIIQNLQKHPKNRTILYQLELETKTHEFFADIRELSQHPTGKTGGMGSQAGSPQSLDDIDLGWLVRRTEAEDAGSNDSDNLLAVSDSKGFNVARGGALNTIRRTIFDRELPICATPKKATSADVCAFTTLNSDLKGLSVAEMYIKRSPERHSDDRLSRRKTTVGLPELTSRLNISFSESCRVRGIVNSEFEDTRGMPDFYIAQQEQAPSCLTVSVNSSALADSDPIGDLITSYPHMFESWWWTDDTEKQFFFAKCGDCMVLASGMWLSRSVYQHASENMTRYVRQSAEKRQTQNSYQDYSGTGTKSVTNEPDLNLAMILFQQIEDQHRYHALSGHIQAPSSPLVNPNQSEIKASISFEVNESIPTSMRWDPGKVEVGKKNDKKLTETSFRNDNIAGMTGTSGTSAIKTQTQQTKRGLGNMEGNEKAQTLQAKKHLSISPVQVETSYRPQTPSSTSTGRASPLKLQSSETRQQPTQPEEECLTNTRTLIKRMKERQHSLRKLTISASHRRSSPDRKMTKVKDKIMIDGVDRKHVFSFSSLKVGTSADTTIDEEEDVQVATPSAATLLTFPHSEGAEYCANLYPHFKLENGAQVHCHYNRHFHRAPFDKIRTPFNSPSRLHDVGLVCPPPPPFPLQMKTDDGIEELVGVPCIVHDRWKQPSGMRVESKRNLTLYSSSQNDIISRMDVVFIDVETLHGVSSFRRQKYSTMPTDAFVQYEAQLTYPEESRAAKILEEAKSRIDKMTTDVVIPVKFQFGDADDDDQAVDRSDERQSIDIFHARYIFSESKDIYNKREVYEKAWQLDVDRIMRKNDLPIDFSRVTKEGVKDVLYEHLYPHFEQIWRLFDFYSTIDLNNVFWTSQVGYKKLYTHLGLPDSRIKQVTLQTIFKQVNVEEGEGDDDLLNPDNSLMRFEFVEVLLRLACHLYPSLTLLDEQLDEFVHNELAFIKRQPEFVAFYPFFGDEYRELYLYSDAVITVLRKHFNNLDLTHRAFARRQTLETTKTGTRKVEIGGKCVFRHKKPLMSYDGWLSFLRCTKLISTDFGKREAAMIFVMSRTRFSNDMDPKEYMEATHLNQTDFLEALCRVAHIKPLPTDEYLEHYCNSSTFEYCKMTLGGLRKLPRNVQSIPDISPFDITMKEPLEKLLEKLMEWVTYTLDTYVGDGDGKLDAKDFRRIQQMMFG